MNNKQSEFSKKIYKFIDRYIQNTFANEICEIINKSKSDKINIFDIGSYLGNFSREIKKNINKKKINKVNFNLFDPHPHIKLNDFNHYYLGISNKSTKNLNLFLKKNPCILCF